jgi:regulator of cell morphogenesis and NO signaling
MITKKSLVVETLSSHVINEGVLLRFGIGMNDWDKSLQLACAENGVDVEFVINILSLYHKKSEHFNSLFTKHSSELIITYLIKSHIYFINNKVPKLFSIIEKLIIEHDEQRLQLLKVKDLFIKYSCHLKEHIYHEENTLFPYVLNLLKTESETLFSWQLFKLLDAYSIGQFVNDHDEVEEDLNDIRNVVIKHSKSSNKNHPLRIIYDELKVLEKDLEIHANLEDKILIPRAIELEKKLKTKLLSDIKNN